MAAGIDDITRRPRQAEHVTSTGRAGHLERRQVVEFIFRGRGIRVRDAARRRIRRRRRRGHRRGHRHHGADPDGDEDAWTAAWRATAERTARRGEESLEAGDHGQCARGVLPRVELLPLSAEFYRRTDPLNDPQVLDLSRLSRDYFVQGGRPARRSVPRGDHPVRRTGRLPGYLFLVDDSGSRAPRSSTPTASTPPARRATS